jgi:hypothetical protein
MGPDEVRLSIKCRPRESGMPLTAWVSHVRGKLQSPRVLCPQSFRIASGMRRRWQYAQRISNRQSCFRFLSVYKEMRHRLQPIGQWILILGQLTLGIYLMAEKPRKLNQSVLRAARNCRTSCLTSLITPHTLCGLNPSFRQ